MWRPDESMGYYHVAQYSEDAECVFPPYDETVVNNGGLCFGTVYPHPSILSATSLRTGADATTEVRALAGPRSNFYRDAEAEAAGVRPLLPSQSMMGPVSILYSDGTKVLL